MVQARAAAAARGLVSEKDAMARAGKMFIIVRGMEASEKSRTFRPLPELTVLSKL